MSNNRYQHEIKRNQRFESGKVESVNGRGFPNLVTGGRNYPRTQVANLLGESVYPGSQLMQLTGGSHDYPCIIGFSPWLT